MPQGICSYITSFCLINYINHCISNTSVHTNDPDFSQKEGVVNKNVRLHRIKFVRWCVFVFVFQRLNTEILC